MRGSTFDRRVALFTGVGLITVVGFLVVRNEPFKDPNLVVLTRIVLSLAVGILGATIPGFLGVKYSGSGLAIRATGALALVVITFFGTPKVEMLKLGAAELELDRLRVVDLRTKLGPERTAAERAAAPAYATVPMAVRSSKEPALRATLSSSSLRLKGAEGQAFDFSWRYFVTMHEEKFGVWLGIDEDVHPLTLEPGAVIFREVLHEPTTTLTWADVLRLFAPGGPDRLEITLSVVADRKSLESRCIVDATYWREQVQGFVKEHGTSPSRITMKCLDEEQPTL